MQFQETDTRLLVNAVNKYSRIEYSQGNFHIFQSAFFPGLLRVTNHDESQR